MVDVGRNELNVFVFPVQAFAADSIAPEVVYVESPYDFVINCVEVVGVCVDVGREVLKVNRRAVLVVVGKSRNKIRNIRREARVLLCESNCH